MLADRAHNPNPQDICHLYDKWRLGNYGRDNGKDLFQKLQKAVYLYNQQHGEDRGKALLQWYSNNESTEQSDKDDDEILTPPKKRSER